MTLKHRNYEAIDPAQMATHPAKHAQDAELVGRPGIETRRAVGVWRWPLLHESRIGDLLADWIAASDRIVDFGGAAGPLGYGALVVDRIADVRGLDEVEGQVDLIFTAHTLEHVADLGLAMCSFHWKLPRGGRLVALVPSYTNEMLRADTWDYHAQTFCLSQHEDAAPEYTRLDQVFIRHGFNVELVASGYNNIIVFGTKA